jgi:hypothetical protein
MINGIIMIDRILLNNFLLFVISLLFTFLCAGSRREAGTHLRAPDLRLSSGMAVAF